jgi:DNA-binding PadR family transcriptional regulator
VLALLIEQPRHPYEMQRLMRERHKDYAIGRPRSFYDAVNRLLAAGLIEPVETTRDGRHPERTIYEITAEGRDEFAAWLNELLAEPATEYSAFHVALSLLGAQPCQSVLAALRQRCVALEAQIAGLDTANAMLQAQLGLPRLVLLEQEHASVLRKAELAWVRGLIADLEAGRLLWPTNPEWTAHNHETFYRSAAPAMQDHSDSRA